ncbi:MAG: ferrous iron transport protein A [Deltaproteobacteria bacterium]|nr:MAG: ferrous iron transport protein A [Deltaproteobacteria bacterium]
MESNELKKSGPERSSEDLSLQNVLSLALAEVGKRIRIISMRGGRGFNNKVVSMGLKVGDEIRVVYRRPGGAVLIAKGQTRYALGVVMTQKILVAEI